MHVMAVNTWDPFPSDALEANRAGGLTDDQRRHFLGLSRIMRQTARGNAGVAVIASAITILGARQAFPAIPLPPIAVAVVVIALPVIARILVRGNALARDLRHVEIRVIVGAIGKRRAWYSDGIGRQRQRYLEVGDNRFPVTTDVYNAAPDTGFVRVYFLPMSRRVVNLERVVNQPMSVPTTPAEIGRALLDAVRSPGQRGLNELRAEMAALTHPPPRPLPAHRDPRPLGQAIIGTWTNGFMTVAFSPDGSVTAQTLGGLEQSGRWSIDAHGRLHAGVTGQQEAADAWVAGDQLVISAEGAGMTFIRTTSG